MFRMRMLQGVRLAALAAVVSLGFGTMALGQDADDYYYRHDEAREHGYQNGYRDGVNRGRYDRMQNYRYNYKSDLWEDADGGYQHWMGSRGRYKSAYRDGYVQGYQRGYGSYAYRRGGDGDRDDYYRWHQQDGWR